MPTSDSFSEPPTHPINDESLMLPFETREGRNVMLDISREATFPLGFLFQDRVATPSGPGTVLGVDAKGILYFKLDTDTSASFWSRCKTAEQFKSRGFRIVPQEIPKTEQNAYHRVKHVMCLNDVKRPIIMQNENGPCPVIALANALSLRDQYFDPDLLDNDAVYVKADKLRQRIGAFLQEELSLPKFTTEDERKDVEGTMTVTLSGLSKKILPTLRSQFGTRGSEMLARFYEGLNVSPMFSHVDGFEGEEDALLFSLAGVRLLHGWIVPETKDVESTVDGSLASVQQRSPNNTQSMDFSRLHSMTYNEVVAAATNDEDEELFRLTNLFLEQSGSQITPEGLIKLTDELQEGEVAVLFRNNHFNSMIKQNGKLFCLVSDEGYADRPSVVFEELTLSGGGVFLDGCGQEVPQHVLMVEALCGGKYTQEEIEDVLALLLSEKSDPTIMPTPEELISKLEKEHEQQAATVVSSSSNQSTPLITASSPGVEGAIRSQPLLLTGTTTEQPQETANKDLEMLTSMGFSHSAAAEALNKFSDVAAAANYLVTLDA